MTLMKDEIDGYIKRVRELAEHVRGNEQATKQSLIGPLFTLLGYDLTDPRECVPEYKADFGKDRSVKPVDWAFFQNGRPLFFVEAKEANRKLAGFDEQLADYFGKSVEVKLGILTNGVHWRFFTDMMHANVMDRSGEPLRGGDLTARVTAPSGKAEVIRFSGAGDEWGEYTGRFEAAEPGKHQVVLTCKQTGATLEATFFVQGVATERVGRPARPEVLEELARVTHGRVVEVGKLEEVVRSLAGMPDPPPSVRRVQLWSHPAVAAGLVVLMGAFWVGRKALGLV